MYAGGMTKGDRAYPPAYTYIAIIQHASTICKYLIIHIKYGQIVLHLRYSPHFVMFII